MKKVLLLITCFAIVILSVAREKTAINNVISAGSQPQVSMDTKGIIRVAFGRADSIFCSSSVDAGNSFSKTVFVAHVAGMHLGNSRGPQIASSANYSVITAIDKQGNIHCFQLNYAEDKWRDKGLVNDIAASAEEGLMSIAADDCDHFYAVWLDVRKERNNNICFSSLNAVNDKWTKNILIYVSPDGHVCECCKPNLAVKGSMVAVMFRNWLNGSRDLYVQTSYNAGKTFGEAKKEGAGTWKLNACPMDGGGITIDNNNAIHTTWQRDGTVYYCRPGEKEISLGKGKACSINFDKQTGNNPAITLQQDGQVKMITVTDKKETVIGEGNYLKSVPLPAEKKLFVWEQDKQIKFKKI